MENVSTAMEIGKRCKKFRNALGISQQALADKIGTTPQNISKYEKEGISNIEVIQEISKALGHDLLTDEVEAEGTVGEIGREILTVLVDFKGKKEVAALLSAGYMFGLSEERIVKEVFKLEKIGLCVREQYMDYYEVPRDDLFITAKGAIYIKHIEKSTELEKKLDEIHTYEVYCEGYNNYQELIDSKPILPKMIKKLNVYNGFRANLIKYLCRYHSRDFLLFNVDEMESPYDEIDLIQGKGIYFDIMFSMGMGITRKDIDYFMECKISDENHEFEEACGLWEEVYKDGSMAEDFWGKFKQLVSVDDIDTKQRFDETVNCKLTDGELKEKQLRFKELDDKFTKQDDRIIELDLNWRYQEACKGRESKNPLDWFDKEDIEDFIKKNILQAVTDEEKVLEEQLTEIMKKEIETVEDYFKFPPEWEKNGLADLILSLYKVPTAE